MEEKNNQNLQPSEAEFASGDFDPVTPGHFSGDDLVRKPTTYWKNVWRTFRQNKAALISACILLILILFVIFGPAMNRYDYYSNDYAKLDMSPNADNWFGTDSLGRDMWTRCWIGGRVSLLIAVIATAISYVIGMIIGGISGYYGGKLDMIIMRAIDILMGIPSLIYLTLLTLVLGSGKISVLIICMCISGWMGPARSVRGMFLQIKSREFVTASKALGASPARMIVRHLLPNIMGQLVVGMTMTIPSLIFAEAFLSYIGLGVVPPNPSWGSLIKEAAAVFKYHPYQFLIPCALISITMLCFNLMGDGFRDALDPKLQK